MDASSTHLRPLGTPTSVAVAPHRRIRLLDADPDLAAGLPPADLDRARAMIVVDIRELEPGTRRLAAIGDPQALGLLVLEGLIMRRVTFAERRGAELLGPGSLLRPWDGADGFAIIPSTVEWRVLEPVRIAVLDRRVAALSASWPSLTTAMLSRLSARSDRLALNTALYGVRHVDVRLLLLFWHLAEHYGRVTPEGTVVPLKLNHADLADLLSNRRPSISKALSSLRTSGRLLRRADRTWLLRGSAPTRIADLPSMMYDDPPGRRREYSLTGR